MQKMKFDNMIILTFLLISTCGEVVQIFEIFFAISIVISFFLQFPIKFFFFFSNFFNWRFFCFQVVKVWIKIKI